MSMDLMLVKLGDGSFRPATKEDIERASTLKIGKEYGCTLTQLRNGKFHRKLIALLEYLYDTLPRHKAIYMGKEVEQSFTAFRKMMVALAGFYTPEVAVDGLVRASSDSISYKHCSQEKAEAIYSAIIDKALEMLGNDQTREDLDDIVNNLMGFA